MAELRFRIANTIGSPLQEGKTAHYIGGRRIRVVRAAGMRLMPGRPESLPASTFVAKRDELMQLEKQGAIVVYHDDKPMTVEAALSLIAGERTEPPYFPLSSVMDPNPRGRAPAAQIRLKREDLYVEPPQPSTEEPTFPKPSDPAVTFSLFQLPKAMELEEKKEDTGEQLLYTVKEAALFVGCSTPSLYKKIKEGKLPATKKGNKTLIAVEDLNKFITSGERE